jgi:putative transposase
MSTHPVRTDNGPEFTSRAFIAWAQGHGIRHILIEPGRPMQNGYIESFNGKFRDECLNDHWFQTLHQARADRTAALDALHRPSLLHYIAGKPTMQPSPATRSISSNLQPVLQPMFGTAQGGRSVSQNHSG